MFEDLPEELAASRKINGINGPVPLYEGEMSISQNGTVWQGEGAIMLEWLPVCRVGLRFRTTSTDWPQFEPSTLNVPGLGANTQLNITRFQPGFDGHSIEASASGFQHGVMENWTRVRFYVPNLPQYVGTPVRMKTGGGALKRLTLTYLHWVFDEEQYKELRNSKGYQITHVGTLARQDGALFSAADCEPVLECLAYFLSFCRGAWTSPMLLSAEDENAAVVGETWRATRIDGFAGTYSWVPKSQPVSVELASAFTGYARLWHSPAWSEALRIITQWYVESSTGAVEKSVILLQTALELLTWVKLVQEERVMTQKQWNDRSAPFCAKLRRLLQAMTIPLTIPTAFSDLEAYRCASTVPDGPEAFTSIRNALVHPSLAKRERLNNSPGALSQAWLLAGWYLDLCMLNILGYKGRYSNRTIRQGWAGDEVEVVPWP
jgi:hypothetical protein